MARIPYLRVEQAQGEAREAIEAVPVNLIRLLAHAESAVGPLLGLIGALLRKLELDERLREVAILHVAKATGASYEWTQHVPIAGRSGLGVEQIAAIEGGRLDDPSLDEPAAATLAFVAELIDAGRPADPTFQRLLDAGCGTREVVELVILVGNYRLLAGVMTALDIDEDPPVSPETFARTTDFMND